MQFKGYIGYFMYLFEQDANFKTYFNILGIIDPEKLAVKVQVYQKIYTFLKKKSP